MAAAAGLCIAVLRWVRVDTLAEFQEKARDSGVPGNETMWKQLALLDLTPEQWGLLDAYDPVLKLVRVKPLTSLAVCPVCCQREVVGTNDTKVAFHGWQLVMGQAPTRCRVTSGCDGKPVKAKVPAQVKTVVDENGNVIAPAFTGKELQDEVEEDLDPTVDVVDPGDLADFGDEL